MLTRKLIQKLQTAQRCIEWYFLGIRMKNKIKIVKIREKSKIGDVAYTIKNIKFKFSGHLARMGEEKWVKKLIEWTLWDHTRKEERSGGRWANEMVRRAGILWKKSARDRKTRWLGKRILGYGWGWG